MRTKPAKFRAGKYLHARPRTRGPINDEWIDDIIHRMFLELERQLYALEHDGRRTPFWKNAVK